MAKYALELLTNEKKYKLFAENSRKRAVERFDKSIVVPLYESYYEQVLKS
jgi:glycosyltransferase involved in cell wall biosynthesis